MRFVIISFLFLGWAFWELSGGADFEPRGVRAPKSERVAETPQKSAVPLVKSEPAALVAKVKLTPYKPEPTRQEETVAPSALTSEERLAALARSRASLGKGLSLFETDPGQTITLASLEQGALSFRVEPTEPGPQDEQPGTRAIAPPGPDLREVTVARVNMRDGPGTIYPVIARLTIGHAVEVLDDSSTGWLRLRVLPEQQIGWIAASLISKKSD
ncbi:SH3 domain-containing protein [Ruegeria marina]|uniref:SH3 domain-containing protein n=1 Tax=Ruegeria marina TaxID=639004 RepID=A0A1G7BN71_9RHOB|nr:SH3 domain-containing protein [Ruegeria marina]SDE28362.1 SH3 domain-containing protein [Ruegeria marina]